MNVENARIYHSGIEKYSIQPFHQGSESLELNRLLQADNTPLLGLAAVLGITFGSCPPRCPFPCIFT